MNLFKVIVLALPVMSLIACSASKKDSGSGGGSSIMTIAGQLSTGSVLSISSVDGLQQVLNASNVVPLSQGAFAISDYKVRCVTLSGTPQAGEGTCDSTGKFSLDLASATNVPIGCFVLNSATSAIVATLAFEQSTTGLDGSNTRNGSIVVGDGAGSLAMGTITLDLDKGLAVVAVADIKTGSGEAPPAPTTTGTFADMNGNWTIHALSSVPSGYVTAGSGNNGPSDGMVIHMGYYTATDGSSGTHHGLSIWQDEASKTACGGEGVTLPSGWTTSDSTLTNSTNVSTSFPLPGSVHISCYGGQNFAGLASSACSGASSGNNWVATAHCSDILASPYSDGTTWSSGSCDTSSCTSNSSHWGMSPVQAAFMCVLNNVNNSSGSCTGEVDIDWGGLWSGGNPFSGVGFNGSAWTGVTATNNSDNVTYFSGHVRFNKHPRNRFMINELSITGNVGTLTDSHHYTTSACASYSSNGSCSGSTVPCHISENDKLTIQQTDASNAIVELVQVTSVSPTDDSLCSTDTKVTEHLGEYKWMFAVTK